MQSTQKEQEGEHDLSRNIPITQRVSPESKPTMKGKYFSNLFNRNM
jgi:hypothetical protein